MATALLFEHVSCTRCGGSGSYSFNQMHGSRCYGCNGTGNQLTKRGRVAQAFYTSLKMRPWTQVKIGDQILFEGVQCGSFSWPSKWATVTAIEPDALNPGHTKLITDVGSYGVVEGSTVRVRRSNAQVAADKKAALEFQATLTKAGKPKTKLLVDNVA